MNALFYVDIDHDIHKAITQSRLKCKMKKLSTWVFFLNKHSKISSISLGQKVECKPIFLKH